MNDKTQKIMYLDNTNSNDVNKSCFPRVLQPDQRELHLLLPEQAFDPIKDTIDQS